MHCSTALDFGTVRKSSNESIEIVFDYFQQLANFWRSGAFHRVGDLVRPTYATGFVLQALADGTSQAKEPRWPASALQIKDGSQTWLPIVATNQAVDIILSAEVQASSGIQASIVSWEVAQARVLVQGGSNESTYKVSCVVSVQSGQTLAGAITVIVDD